MARTGFDETAFVAGTSVVVPIPPNAQLGDYATAMLFIDGVTSAPTVTATGWLIKKTEVSSGTLHGAAYLLTRTAPLDSLSGNLGTFSWSSSLGNTVVVQTHSGRSGFGTAQSGNTAAGQGVPSLIFDVLAGDDISCFITKFNGGTVTVSGFTVGENDTSDGTYSFTKDNNAAGTVTATPSSASDQWWCLGIPLLRQASASPNSGSALITVEWSAAASGSAAHAGSASASLVWSAAAAGSTAHSGSAAVATAWSATASGTAPPVGGNSGSAATSTAWSTTASGSTVHSGSAAVTTAWADAATGQSAPATTRNITIALGPISGGWDTATPSGSFTSNTQNVTGWATDTPDGGWPAPTIYA